MHATLASGDVDLCLVPEISIELEGDRGCLPFLLQRVREQGHAVVSIRYHILEIKEAIPQGV